MLQCARPVHRHTGIDVAQRLANRAERGNRRLAGSYVHDCAAREVVLEERDEHLARNFVADARILRVLHDADDLDRRLRAGIDSEADVTAERRALAEIMLRVTFGDDGY